MLTVPEQSPDGLYLALEDQVSYNFATSNFPNNVQERHYMPEGRLPKLITKAAIIREFSRQDDWEESSSHGEVKVDVDKDLIEFITASAPKIFAITLISGITGKHLHTLMKKLRASNYGDNKLPASMDGSKPPWPWSDYGLTLRRRLNGNQWRFLVPTFPENEVEMNLQQHHILPLKLVPNTERIEGNFSNVWKVTIDEAHLERPMVIMVISSC